MERTLILGGGFGGIAAATELKRLLGDEHEVVLVDRAESFAMGLRKLWELVGQATIAEGSRSRALLSAHGIRVVRGEISSIDPSARSAVVDGETLHGDHLVVALGAVSRPDLVPGLAEHGHDLWTAAGVPAAARALRDFDGGRIVILVAGAPYPCPPAPFECAFHVDEHLRGRSLRSRAELEVATIQPILMPNAGPEGSAWMAARLAERGIGHRAGVALRHVEAGRVVAEDDEIPFDLLLAVPPHRVPDVVAASGLVAEHGWVAVDRGTLATSFENVYAVGDVTLIPLPSKLPLPKAGVTAELEGLRVARAIAASVRGEPEPAPFSGRATCFVEMGRGLAARIDAEFFAEPAPRIEIAEPSAALGAEKRAFERERLARWFGG
ncbi:MAG: FAD-dependent oxidoreductase [Thermoleophilia bacterium]|nr:FAD-dependent oxidoreductase [Gaiellaceae bacterium]MDW8339809.1 FAD-dependent oxidoreductase [Thermoleophilia bacterium]